MWPSATDSLRWSFCGCRIRVTRRRSFAECTRKRRSPSGRSVLSALWEERPHGPIAADHASSERIRCSPCLLFFNYRRFETLNVSPSDLKEFNFETDRQHPRCCILTPCADRLFRRRASKPFKRIGAQQNRGKISNKRCRPVLGTRFHVVGAKSKQVNTRQRTGRHDDRGPHRKLHLQRSCPPHLLGGIGRTSVSHLASPGDVGGRAEKSGHRCGCESAHSYYPGE